jgi:Domain of unknown function (DUF5753)
MRAIAAAYGANGDRIDDIVALRKARQERAASRRVEQIYILDEAALRRKVGDTMPDQLRHLIALAEKPHITIRVITFDAGPYFGMRGPFVILCFNFGLDDVLYLESARRGDLIIGPGGHEVQGDPEDFAAAQVDDVAVYHAGFDSMMDIALDRADSIKFIERVLGEMLARSSRLRSRVNSEPGYRQSGSLVLDLGRKDPASRLGRCPGRRRPGTSLMGRLRLGRHVRRDQ